MAYESEIHTFHSGRPQPESSSALSTFTSVDPSNAQPLATIYTTTCQQLDDAVASAQAAFPSWAARTPPSWRATILLRAAGLLWQSNDKLGLMETLDTGKALSEISTVDIVTDADVLEYLAHLVAAGLPGQHVKLRTDAHFVTSYEPLGVCAGIVAWNYPLQIALWKLAPCLAAGNCMVYKPSEVTPIHANALAQIYVDARVPPGVFNVVYGDGPSLRAPLVSHPGIAKGSHLSSEEKDFPTQEGFWVPPVIFSDCTDDMPIAKEEIFGPVMCILPYETESREDWLAELIRRANNTLMGLAAGVVSSDVGCAQSVVQQLNAGITWVNTWGESPAKMPVGGWKMSGLGVENGQEGIQAYLRTKTANTISANTTSGSVSIEPIAINFSEAEQVVVFGSIPAVAKECRFTQREADTIYRVFISEGDNNLANVLQLTGFPHEGEVITFESLKPFECKYIGGEYTI
ncbi:Betaine aldehyde dehydrogenase [Fusarium sp. LHS14.1]|nr:Betaine aldehyde dehydrogenase [Fusarium sp. LHS14.1]